MEEKQFVEVEFADDSMKTIKAVHIYVENVANDSGYISKKNAISIDFIWDKIEYFDKQWLENDSLWCKNMADAYRELLEDWECENGESNS